MADPLFTVLLPVHRPPDLMVHALRSVLAQSLADFELLVLCDGAPPDTVAAAERLAAGDPRVAVRVFPKGEHKGERWRHQLLTEARGRYCCQIGDDDLWFPNHLAEAAKLLEKADFGNLLYAGLAGGGEPMAFFGDLADAACRRRLLEERWNFFGPTCAAYRLSAYRSLPEGWAPPPPDVWSDLHMWRKFLRQGSLACETRFAVTALCLPNDRRQGWSLAERAAEQARRAREAADPAWREAFAGETLRRYLEHFAAEAHAAAEAAALRQEGAARARAERSLRQLQRRERRLQQALDHVERSRVWRLRCRIAGWLRRP